MVEDGRIAPFRPWRPGPVLAALAFGVVYLLAALAGLWFRVPETGIAAFWPAAGVSFAVLYLAPRRLWGGILVGLVVADLTKNVVAGFGPGTAVLVTAGNALEPLIANLVVGGGRDELDPVLTPRSLGRFLIGAAVSTTASGLVGATGIAVGFGGDWPETYLTWVLGDLTAQLAFGSIAIAWAARGPRHAPPAHSPAGRPERVALLALLAAAVGWTFWVAPPALSQPYALLVLVGWVSLRSGAVPSRIAALGTVVAGGVATVGGHGRFADAFSTPLSQWAGFQIWAAAVVVTVLGITVEIDRRRRAERQLARDNDRLQRAREQVAASEARFRSMAAAAPVGIFRTDAEGRHVYGNAALHEITGRGEDELVAVGWQDLVHPDDRERAVRDFRDAVDHGRSATTDMRMRRPDGSLRWVAAGATPCPDPAGGMDGLVGTLTDRTEEHRAEERRRAEYERFLLAFLHSASPMWVTSVVGDDAGRTVEVNPAMCDMLLVDREGMVGRPSLDFVDPADRDAVGEAVLGAVRHGGSVSHDVRMRRADGSAFWANYLIGVAHDAEGRARYVVGHLRDVDAARAARLRLTTMATTDPLTGIANRNLLLERMSDEIEQARRTDSGLAVLFLDLDRFKTINDSLGHRAGDELLQAVARRLSSMLRHEDTLARLGGDEFVVVCPWVAGPDHARRIADRLRGCFVEPFAVGDRMLHVGASIGISLLGSGPTGPTELIDAADSALYRAKEKGRSRVEVYSDDLRLEAESRLRTEELIRWALDEDRLRLHAQPICDAATGTLWGREALVRIEGPDGRIVPPDEWLPTAEASGLIVPVGDWVFRRALGLLCTLHDGAVMSVNVSARQLQDADMIDVIEEALDGSGGCAGQLVLEMTESVLLEAGAAAVGLDRLRRRGVRIAIDDFGTGYSSLSYLKDLPADIVKIDRSFISGLGADRGDTAIVEAVVGLAERLGLVTIAEGIETEAQLSAVRDLGCGLVQGFLLGRPAEIGTGVLRPAGTRPS